MSNAKFLMIIALLFRILVGIEDWGQAWEMGCQFLFSFSVIWQWWNGGEPYKRKSPEEMEKS